LRARCGRAITRTVAAGPSRWSAVPVRREKAGPRRTCVVGGTAATDRDGLVRHAGGKSDRQHQPWIPAWIPWTRGTVAIASEHRAHR
jgi:hypothetical protein